MKLKKLIKRINAFADADLGERIEKDNELKKTLRKLKQKGAALAEALQAESDPMEREALEDKLRIVQAQRKKGIALRRELKEALKED